jgi:hypothetical protein
MNADHTTLCFDEVLRLFRKYMGEAHHNPQAAASLVVAHVVLMACTISEEERNTNGNG